jgi:hypothetical protein
LDPSGLIMPQDLIRLVLSLNPQLMGSDSIFEKRRNSETQDLFEFKTMLKYQQKR